jgi:hypothetical protein
LNPDGLEVARKVARALESVGIDYLIGGSMASSFVGKPRSTMDVDFVVRMTQAQIQPLVEALGDDFFVDPSSLARAVRERSSANLIHSHSAIKADLFILGSLPHEQAQMDRRRRMQVSDDPADLLYISSPEDTVIQKLRWFRLGGEVSDHQWKDVLAVLRYNRTALDRGYLASGAKAFGVDDLLKRADSEAT